MNKSSQTFHSFLVNLVVENHQHCCSIIYPHVMSSIHFSVHNRLMMQKGPLCLLFVDPSSLGTGPADKLILVWEPKSNLLFGALDAVRAVAHVAANVNGVVEANGAWGGSEWVGSTKDETASLDNLTALPDHGANWARSHVLLF